MTEKFKEEHRYDLPLGLPREKKNVPDSDKTVERTFPTPTTVPTESVDSTNTSNIDTTWKDSDVEKISFVHVKNLDELLNKYAASSKEFTIYVDMDGVLVDFDKGFRELSGKDPLDYMEEHGKPAFWKALQKEPRFFLNLDWMPDGEELWNYIEPYNPTVLTTPVHSMKYCKEDKKSWAEGHLGKDRKVIFSFKKEEYATPTSILIDDRDKNIIPWNASGGIGILHISTNSTTKELKKILIKK